MNIVIAGAGAVGTHLAKMLSRQEHNILLIDSDPAKIEIWKVNWTSCPLSDPVRP